jgi:predicted MFS family arabinose efflux permease
VTLLSPLRVPLFRRIWVGQLLNVAGDGLYLVAVPLVFLGTARAAVSIGVVLAGEAVGRVLALLFGGALADRYSQTRIIICSDVLRAAAVALFIVLAPASPLAVLASVSMLVGIGDGIYTPAFRAVLPSIVSEDTVVSANALRSLTNRFAMIAGGVLGGLTVAWLGARQALWVDVATFAASGVTLLGVKFQRREAGPSGELSLIAMMGDGFTYVRKHRWMCAVMAQGALFGSVVVATLTVMLPVVVGTRSTSYGLIVASEGAGAVLGAYVASRFTGSRPGLFAVCGLSLQAAECIALAVTAPDYVIAVCAAVGGLGSALFGVLWITALQVGVPRAMIGRVLSIDALVNNAFAPVGLAAMGAVIGVYGYAAIGWAAALVAVTSSLALVFVHAVSTFGDPEQRHPKCLKLDDRVGG